MRIALVTGPSAGIGRATALEMARRGFHVVAAGRSEERTRPVVAEITRAGGSAEFLNLDLASLESARVAAHTFEESGRSLDVLINNAGVGGVKGATDDGFEIHFGVNHLGHFMLTHHLRRTFRPGTRIVVVSSEVHRRADGIDFRQVQRPGRSIAAFSDYGVSKLANVLFARRLAVLQPEWRTYSLHPGVVATEIFPAMAGPFLRNGLTPAEGAQTSVWCATSDQVEGQSGLYYSDRAQRQASTVALDDELAVELWDRSEEWCGIADN